MLGEYEQKAKRYTSKKNSFITVTIAEKKIIKKQKRVQKKIKKQKVEEKKEKKIQKIEKKIEKKVKKKSKEKIKKSIKRTTQVDPLKSLFKSIDTKKFKKIKDRNITLKKEQNQNSRIPQKAQNSSTKKLSASKIIKSLTLENASVSDSKKTGEYDKYIGKISDILDEKWQETPGSIAGNSASVTVKIDKFGNFSYKIDSLSYNNEFNAKLENFLESLKDEKFPPYEKGDFIELKVNFKDE